jgi:hypothetical protein
MNIYQLFNYLLDMAGKLVAKADSYTDAGHKLFLTARACIGKDMAPTENELGCAEAVNEIVFKAFGDYAGGDKSTYRMYHAIRDNKKFVQVYSPRPGDIVLSPTGYGNGTIPNGHTGIMGEFGAIMSNNSSDGLFLANYTLTAWRNRYQKQGGYPVLFYRRIIQ